MLRELAFGEDWGDPAHHHCPRCGESGDPRTCTCMRRLSRYIAEARRRINRGETFHAGGQLTEAERLLELLALDAQKAARDRRPRRPRHETATQRRT